MKELRSNDAMQICLFDKGAGFVVLHREDAIGKLREQIGEAKVCSVDPTNALTRKFQQTIRQFKKDKKLDMELFRQMYPSDAVPPRLYGLVKAHKPTKRIPYANCGIHTRCAVL